MAELDTINKTAERAQAENLGVTEWILRRWVSDGSIPITRSGNRSLIYYPNLIKFLETGTQPKQNRPRYGRGSRGGKY